MFRLTKQLTQISRMANETSAFLDRKNGRKLSVIFQNECRRLIIV